MLNFARKFYEKRLEKNIIRWKIPSHLMVVTELKEFFENFSSFRNLIRWCKKFGIDEITFCIHIVGKRYSFSGMEDLIPKIEKFVFEEGIRIRLVSKNQFREWGEGKPTLNFILGYGGRAEITDAVKEIAKIVKSGDLHPEEIEEKDIEKHLKIKNPPDLIIRAGEEIPDFLIWQSIYSELYFMDIEWKSFRYVDFLRCIREYQKRERRFGQ